MATSSPQLPKQFTNFHTWRPTSHKRWIQQAVWLETQSKPPPHRQISGLLASLKHLPPITDGAAAIAVAARFPFLMRHGATAPEAADMLYLVAAALTHHPLVRGIVYSRPEGRALITELCDATAAARATFLSPDVVDKAAKAQAMLGCYCPVFWDRGTRALPVCPALSASLLVSAAFIQGERDVAVLTLGTQNTMFERAASGAASFDTPLLAKLFYAASTLFKHAYPPVAARASLVRAAARAAPTMSLIRLEIILVSAASRWWLAAPELVAALKARAESFTRMPADSAATIHRCLHSLPSSPSYPVRKALLAAFEHTNAAAHVTTTQVCEVLWVLRATLLRAYGSSGTELRVLHAQAEAVLITVGIYLQDSGPGGGVDVARELVRISWLWPEALEKLPLGAAEAAAAPALASWGGEDVAHALEILARSRPGSRADPATGPALCAAAARAGPMSPREVACTVWALQELGVAVDAETRRGLEGRLKAVRTEMCASQYQAARAALAGSSRQMQWPPPVLVPAGDVLDLRWPREWQNTPDVGLKQAHVDVLRSRQALSVAVGGAAR